jgi:methanogenic corrinoid protein MtbC1
VAEYLRAVLDKDKERSSLVVTKMLDEGFDMASVFRVLGEAQVEIGELWERGVIGIGDEQFSTATTLECVTFVAIHFRRFRRETRGLALLCPVEGEFHQVALRMLRELLRERGWDAEVLAHDKPILDLLARATSKGSIDLLCFSAVMPASIPKLVQVLRKIREDPRFSGVKVIVGGPLFKSKRARAGLTGGSNGTGLADLVSTDFAKALDYVDSLNR